MAAPDSPTAPGTSHGDQPASSDGGDERDRDPSTRMHAVVRDEYGSPDVLRLATVPRPALAADEVLVRVHAAGVNAGDAHMLRGTPYVIRPMYGGFRAPDVDVLGMDVAGRVAAVGDRVTAFAPGDAVFGDVSVCDYGAFAEYVAATPEALVPKPPSVSFEAAAATPVAGVSALQALRDAGPLAADDRVLVNGASGGVGSFATQLAAAADADVTGVASTPKLPFVRSLGADRVLDYTETAYPATDDRYDLIVDCAAAHSIRANLRALRPAGRYVMVGGPTGRFFGTMALGLLVSRLGTKQYGAFELDPDPDDLAALADRLADGTVAPAVDRAFPLAETPDAFRFLGAGHARGKVVVTPATVGAD